MNDFINIYEKSCLLIGNIVMPICLLLLTGEVLLFIWLLINKLIDKIK